MVVHRGKLFPILTEFLSVLQEEDEIQYGIEICDWDTSLVNLYENKDNLISLFNRKFAFREISIETVALWQFEIENKFKMMSPEFDYAYGLMKNNNVEKLGSWSKTKMNSNGMHNFVSVPENLTDNEKPDTKDYNNSASDMETESGSNNLEMVMNNINMFRDIDELFLDEFETFFTNIHGVI